MGAGGRADGNERVRGKALVRIVARLLGVRCFGFVGRGGMGCFLGRWVVVGSFSRGIIYCFIL